MNLLEILIEQKAQPTLAILIEMLLTIGIDALLMMHRLEIGDTFLSHRFILFVAVVAAIMIVIVATKCFFVRKHVGVPQSHAHSILSLLNI